MKSVDLAVFPCQSSIRSLSISGMRILNGMRRKYETDEYNNNNRQRREKQCHDSILKFALTRFAFLSTPKNCYMNILSRKWKCVVVRRKMNLWRKSDLFDAWSNETLYVVLMGVCLCKVHVRKRCFQFKCAFAFVPSRQNIRTTTENALQFPFWLKIKSTLIKWCQQWHTRYCGEAHKIFIYVNFSFSLSFYFSSLLQNFFFAWKPLCHTEFNMFLLWMWN